MTDFNVRDTESLPLIIESMARRVVAVERRSPQFTEAVSVVEVQDLDSRPDPEGPDSYCYVVLTADWYETSPNGFLPPPNPPIPVYQWVTSTGPPVVPPTPVPLPDPLLISDGTAAAPSLAFTADTDTGIFRAGTNEIGFTAGGVELLSVGSVDVDVLTGHLNVVSNTGSATITLGEYSGGSNLAAIETSSFYQLMGTGNANDAAYFRTKGSGPLIFGAAHGSDLTIINGGNVGIGTPTPANKLEVWGAVQVSSTTGNGSSHFPYTDGRFYYTAAPETGGVGDHIFSTFSTGSYVEQMRILDNGNVSTVGDITAGGDIITADGSAAAPSHTFTSDTDTGMYRQGTNEVGFATGGTENLRLTGSNLRMASATSVIYNTGYFRGVAATGTESSPTYSWDGDTNTGMYLALADNIGWSVGSVRKMQLSPDRLYLFGGTGNADYIGPINNSYFYNVTASAAFYFNKTIRCVGSFSSHSGDLVLQRALSTKMTMTTTTNISNQQFKIDGPNVGTGNRAWSNSQLLIESLNSSGTDATNSLVQIALHNDRANIAPIIRSWGPSGESVDFTNNPNTAYIPIRASAFLVNSTIRVKQDIEAVEDADAIALAEKFLLTSFTPKVRPQNTIVSNRFKDVSDRWEASSPERTALTPRSADWESHDHDCTIDPCDGDADNPCQICVNDTRRFGGLAEWWGDVTPEQVSFDGEGIADSIDIDQVATTALGATGALSRKLTTAMETIAALESRLAALEQVE